MTPGVDGGRSPAVYMAVFDRIGANRDVAPLDLTGDDPAGWCEQIETYAGRFINSRHWEVDLYPGPPTMPDRGTITAGVVHNAGRFRIEEQS